MTPTTTRRVGPVDPPPLLGDETDLFDRYQPALRRVVSSRSRACPQTVEDACSSAWMQLVATQPRRDRIFGWLCKVATREAWRMSVRSERVRQAAAVAEGARTPDPTVEERVCSRERAASLGMLNTGDRQLLLLAAVGYTHDEIAASTGHSVRAVRRRMGRARSHLDAQDLRAA